MTILIVDDKNVSTICFWRNIVVSCYSEHSFSYSYGAAVSINCTTRHTVERLCLYNREIILSALLRKKCKTNMTMNRDKIMKSWYNIFCHIATPTVKSKATERGECISNILIFFFYYSSCVFLTREPLLSFEVPRFPQSYRDYKFKYCSIAPKTFSLVNSA